ncbi:uncharacterized protein [Dermacentor albipictus]|uniref:uncharacterized protein n=2 Tax=Dermacentor albipictus TaxID=60249 RepID=UPI0038FCB214
MKNAISCTSNNNIWLPAYVEKVQFRRLKDIDFTSSRMKKRKLDDENSSTTEVEPKKRLDIPPPTEEELGGLYRAFKTTNVVPALFSVLPEYCESFQEPVRSQPAHLRKLYSEQNLADDLDMLLKKAKNFLSEFSVGEGTIKSVEAATRQQSNSSDWFLYRAGRVTASVMKRVCHTNIESPSISLLKSVCYPEKNSVRVPAVMWGLDHEQDALRAYTDKEATKHHDFQCRGSGLHLSTAYPFIGASPDAIVSCSCCGKGVVELKCPFLLKGAEEITTQNSCLRDTGGTFKLKTDHAYYYQIQTQMTVCQVQFCDFVVWGPNVLHIERVRRDEQFCIKIFAQAKQFFERVILPELFSRYYTRQQSNLEDKLSDDVEYCFCRGPDTGKMVACDSASCQYKWFHFSCLGLKQKPRAKKWFCPQCKDKTD